MVTNRIKSRSSGGTQLPLSQLRSLGPTSAALLADVGIEDVATLRNNGAVKCFTVLRKRFGKRITVNWIYALECAVCDLDWRLLKSERKLDLRSAARKIIDDIDTP